MKIVDYDRDRQGCLVRLKKVFHECFGGGVAQGFELGSVESCSREYNPR